MKSKSLKKVLVGVALATVLGIASISAVNACEVADYHYGNNKISAWAKTAGIRCQGGSWNNKLMAYCRGYQVSSDGSEKYEDGGRKYVDNGGSVSSTIWVNPYKGRRYINSYSGTCYRCGTSYGEETHQFSF